MNRKPKLHQSEQLANEQITQIVDYMSTRHGFITRLAKEMTRISKPKRVWLNESISRMLTTNPKRRVQPAWGTGIMLMQAFENLKAREGNEN